MTNKIKNSQKICPHGAFENFGIATFLNILLPEIDMVAVLEENWVCHERSLLCLATATSHCFPALPDGLQFGLKPVNLDRSTSAVPQMAARLVAAPAIFTVPLTPFCGSVADNFNDIEWKTS